MSCYPGWPEIQSAGIMNRSPSLAGLSSSLKGTVQLSIYDQFFISPDSDETTMEKKPGKKKKRTEERLGWI